LELCFFVELKMKKIGILLVTLTILVGCNREYDSITLSTEVNNVEYLLSVSGDSASITKSNSTETFKLKYRDSDEFGFYVGDSTLSFKQQPKVNNWICVSCVDHGYPIIWKQT
jgi:hypothetical protein